MSQAPSFSPQVFFSIVLLAQLLSGLSDSNYRRFILRWPPPSNSRFPEKNFFFARPVWCYMVPLPVPHRYNQSAHRTSLLFYHEVGQKQRPSAFHVGRGFLCFSRFFVCYGSGALFSSFFPLGVLLENFRFCCDRLFCFCF